MEISRGDVRSYISKSTCAFARPKFTNMTAGTHISPSTCCAAFARMSLEEKSSVPQGVAGTPNETALLSLMERSGYSMIQENGQRKYGGPPPGWEGPAPLRGCEIFIGKIPRDCYEDELVPVFERIGRIYELRLMMDFSGSNRGYAFVMYTHKNDAHRAVKELNNFEIRKGRFLGVCMSVDNCRLFVGGIPKTKKKEEILQEIRKVTEGVVDVIVYPSATDKAKNRGFAFVEYESHRAAAMARRKLIPGRIQLWGHPIAVDWAEPEQEVDEDVMCTVKILYVRNLMLSTTEETIEKAFNKAVGKDNAVERVKKIKDYAFVHFRDRDDALLSMNIMNNTTLDNSLIEVVLAKPVDKNDYVRFTRTSAGRGGLMQVEAEWADLLGKQPEYASYGYEPATAAAYTAAAAAPAAYYSQYGAAAAAASLMFDRGFQNRNHHAYRMSGALRGRGRGAAGSRGAGNRGYIPMRGPYRKHPTEDRFVDIIPGMELTPTNPVTLKPQSAKSPVQVLEDLCNKNGWGSPIFQLNSTMTREGGSEIQLFLYKVSIPALSNNPYSPNKLCRSVDEAKLFASEYVLMQLGVMPETGGETQLPVATSVVTSPTPAYQGHPLIGTYSFSNGTAASLPATATNYMMASMPGKIVSPPPATLLQTHMIGYDPQQYQAALSAIPYAQYQ